MRTLCQRTTDGTCSQCGQPMLSNRHRTCPQRGSTPERTGLGDLTAEFFSSLGITPERYRAVKETLHLGSGCGCDARQEWLNDVGEKLGVMDTIGKMRDWRRYMRVGP